VRIETRALKELKVTYRATVETQPRIIRASKLISTGVAKIDRSVIPFLYPSRYCQSDKLSRLAFSKFGKIRSPFDKVAAISDWIHDNVQYLSGSTDSSTSAYDTVAERAGVCRDFAHLGIALCRALNIPARYFAGYAHQLNPPDFHACFEAYVGQCWLLFDATRLAPLNGLVRIATGRDAAEASVASIFGPATSKSVQVSCEVVGGGFKPLSVGDLQQKGICADPA
jgi:transglutaminase-like putative cysteine protease